MPRIFISYRRSDSYAETEAIYNLLCKSFGKRNVFRDVDKPDYGAPFPHTIQREVSRAHVVFVVIGSNWVDARDDKGHRRLNNPTDFVRREIEIGLDNRRTRVIPLLLGDTEMPNKADLPDTLHELVKLQALQVRFTPGAFEDDMSSVIQQIKRQYLRWPRFLLAALAIIALVLIVMASTGNLDNPPDDDDSRTPPPITSEPEPTEDLTPQIPTSVPEIEPETTAVAVIVRIAGNILETEGAASDVAYCGDADTPTDDPMTAYEIQDFVATTSTDAVALARSSDPMGWVYIQIENPGQLLQLDRNLNSVDAVCRLWINQSSAQTTQGAFSLLVTLPCNETLCQ